jgi:hypothetical protein
VSVVCSLPDLSELGLSVGEYKAWWTRAADALFAGLSPGQFAIFYQSDARVWKPAHEDGPTPEGCWAVSRCAEWVDKAGMASAAAQRAGAVMIWHKILTAGEGPAAQALPMSVGRPCYSHLLCFGVPDDQGQCMHDPRSSLSPDVMGRGPQLWDRGAGLVGAHVACAFLAAQPQVASVFSPCCGVGTFVAMANACGLDGVGLEENGGRCSEASRLQLSLEAVVAYRVETQTLPPSAAGVELAMATARRSCVGK